MTDEEVRNIATTVAAEVANTVVLRATEIASKTAAEVAAKEAFKLIIKEVVSEVLTGLGFDMKNPTQIQQNNAFVQTWRESSTAIKRQMWFVGGGILLAGIFGLIAAWIKAP